LEQKNKKEPDEKGNLYKIL